MEALLAEPGDQRTLSDWAIALGVSGRTITRAFHRETGQGFTQWVAAVRAHRAAQLLADGEPIVDVMEDVGYTS
ncbi:helix-turn-helix domain-containing protein [Tessaracoccus terricola]